MRIKILFAFIVFVLCFLPAKVIAQDNKANFHYNDRIILKTNQIIFGQLIDYSQDSIILLMKSGSQLKLLSSQIKKVSQYLPEKAKHHAHSKHYLAIGAGLMFGNQKSDLSPSNGYETSVVYKNFNKSGHVFLAGIGYETYNIDIPIVHLPLIAGYEYHIPFSTNNNFFFGFRTGYSFVISDEPSDNTPYEAGWFLNPTIGLLFNVSSKVGFFVETGLKLQQANHSFDELWWRIKDERQINSRYLLRIGLQF